MKSKSGFFSVIIVLVGISLLLFNVAHNAQTPNYYPEFISKNEMQYLYLNNIVTRYIAESFESYESCDFDFNAFKIDFESKQSSFCDDFNDSSFLCDVKINSIALAIDPVKTVSVVLDINNNYKKGDLDFSYYSAFTFKKIINSNLATSPPPDGTDVCDYVITDVDSQISEKEGQK